MNNEDDFYFAEEDDKKKTPHFLVNIALALFILILSNVITYNVVTGMYKQDIAKLEKKIDDKNLAAKLECEKKAMSVLPKVESLEDRVFHIENAMDLFLEGELK